MKKKYFSFDFLMIIIYVPLVLLISWKGFKEYKPEKIESNKKNESNKLKEGCQGFGNEGCISKVRDNFISTGKQILGEEYLGNGQFGISFFDPTRGQTYNSKISTNCNCEILNVDVNIMR
jgi:uncharacterized protein (DUF2147 family)